MEVIRHCKELQKTRYVGIPVQFFVYERVASSHYFIGTISNDSKWKRDVYKVYNALEDESLRALWTCSLPERQFDDRKLMDHLMRRTPEQRERSKYFCKPKNRWYLYKGRVIGFRAYRKLGHL